MKLTLSWLKEHLETTASLAEIAAALTAAGLEVEGIDDPASRLAAFSVARVLEARPHPSADRLQVCRAQTIDGEKEIVCGAPNARAGLMTIYAPIGAYIPGTGITLEARKVRGVVSNGMLCSAAELETAEDADGILELPSGLEVGQPAAEALGLESVLDLEVTPNRPDWLGVQGIARDLAAQGLGRFIEHTPKPVPGRFPLPIEIRLPAPGACPAFAGRLIRGVRNGPSPEWLQKRLISIGLRPINTLADITNLLTHDRARPLHVYDAARLEGGFIEARMGREGERVAALDGRTYAVDASMCAIADGSGAIGLGGVIGGESTGCTEATTEVFIESAWFDPITTARTGRRTGIHSDAEHRFARGVDPASLAAGIEAATTLILELCGGEPSEVVLAGKPPAPPGPVPFDPAYVERLGGLAVAPERARAILADLGFRLEDGRATPPSWRADVEGKADLVEEILRIAGYGALPSTPLTDAWPPVGGVLTARQNRLRIARRELASAGWREALTFSFIPRAHAALFGGGAEALVLDNPISAELDCMRPSGIPALIAAAERNRRRGLTDAVLFEIGPIFASDDPAGQGTSVAGVLGQGRPRRWDGAGEHPLFALKADVAGLLAELGAPPLQLDQKEVSPWWRPGRAARLRLGKATVAELGEIHPRVVKAMDAEGPILAFELFVEALPEPRRKAVKTRPPADLPPLMPLSRDFAFLVAAETPASDLVRAAEAAERSLIATVQVFDVYAGEGVPADMKSIALEVVIQPRAATLNEAEIEALSARIVASVEKQTGARLRS